ncbi:hypothetical protein, partial [Bacteroides caecigallinarum]|uniref:hypothetical protein n=1 Tax=Bacteroides caecigallinarum TaxID=1411144 RepID=UPI001959C20F
QPFKIFFAKHNLSSFKFSTKVWEREILVNTPILEAYYSKRQISIPIHHHCIMSEIVSPINTISE